MHETVKKHPDSYTKNNVCGRVKNINYNGTTLKGSWEVKTAKWLDLQNIRWTNECDSFEYKYKQKTHLYFPDFYLIDLDVFIEVKGYKVERDTYKWNSVPNKLIIIDKNSIHKLDKLNINDVISNNTWLK